jgi:hypothetical protein
MQNLSPDDQKRVDQLGNEGKTAMFLNEVSFLVAGVGGGMLGHGFLKKSQNYKNVGLVTMVAGLAGVIGSLYKILKVSTDIHKIERQNMVSDDQSLSDNTPVMDMEKQQGSNTWEAKMAERKCGCAAKSTPSV